MEKYTAPVQSIKSYVEPIGYRYNIRIDDIIEEPSLHHEEILQIRQAKEGDIVHLFIACDGGNADTMMVILNAMEQSKAYIICELEAPSASAASFIFLGGDEFIVSDNASLMLHEVQWGTYGTGSLVQKRVDFQTKQTRNLVEKYYKHFLSEEEIESVLKGDELYINAEEIITRLEKRAIVVQEEYKVSQQEAYDQQMKELLGEPLPKEAFDNIDRETLIRLIRGEVSEEEEVELFGEYLEDCQDIELDNGISEDGEYVLDNLDLEGLKIIAKTHGITFPHNIGMEALRKKIKDYYEETLDN